MIKNDINKKDIIKMNKIFIKGILINLIID